MIACRCVIAALALASLVGPFAADAQRSEKMVRIGFLGMDSGMQSARVDALKDGLRALGYFEGRNMVFEARWAEGRVDRLPELSSELIGSNVDVIVTATPLAIRAMQRATMTIPIIMTSNDPVGLGFVTSFAQPGGNITGPAHQDLELSVKRLDLLRQAVPELARVAVLWNKEGFGAGAVQVVENAARTMGIQTLALEVQRPEDFAAALAKAKAWGARGLIELFSPLLTRNRKLLLEQLNANRLPTICDSRIYVVDGCLMAYGADLDASFRRMAYYVDRILKGAKPADLPVEQSREFEFVVNQRTAQLLGLKLPSSLMLEATEVIR